MFLIGIFAVLLSASAVPALAQSPNTSSIIVAVVDQTGAVVTDATVTVINSATCSSRAAASDDRGLATITALPLTGAYTIQVSKSGFTANDVTDLTLRAAETATVKVTLV